MRVIPVGLIFIVVVALPVWGQAPVVTATQWVNVGSKDRELLRKINGRWWTQDNRLVYPPSQGGMIAFWEVSSKPGVVEFYHHRAFDVRRAEQLRLFMKPDEVEAMFGPPNRRFPMRSARGGKWYYQGADGTILDLWFLGDDELGEAKYILPNNTERPVGSIEQELAGRSIFSVMAQRGGGGGSSRTITEVAMPNTSVPVVKRIVANAAIDAVKVGMGREEVVEKLGAPTYKSAITGGNGFIETYSYFVDENTQVSIQLLNGKVTRVR